MSASAWRRPALLGLAGVLALLPLAYLVLKVAQGPSDWRVGFEAAFTGWSYYAVPWVAGAAMLTYSMARGSPGHRALGIGLMTVPVWETVWGILDSVVELLQGGFTFRPFTRHELSSLYSNKLLEDLGYVGSGFLLYASDGFGDVLRQTPRRLAKKLVAVGFAVGMVGRPRSEGRSLLAGLLVFQVLLLATIAVNWYLGRVESLNQSDESSIFDNMTVLHAVLISLAAGFGEELVYRGVLLVGLSRRMPMLVAIVVQAVVFGLAHGGYGTWSHVLLPALFGLVAGLIAWAFGIWAAITLHVMVDLFAFGADASSNVPELGPLIVYAFIANCALTFAWSVLWAVKRFEARRAPPAA
jgi:membrane protease YdiL (CAAX protease family)